MTIPTQNRPNSYFVTAIYSPSDVPSFANNPLIEALPPVLDDEKLIESISLVPFFEKAQRELPTEQRLLLLKSLSNFMVPLRRHLLLCRALESMLRTGYVGRAPHTPGHAKIFQEIYAKQMSGISFSQSATTLTPQNATTLIGVSGMGKTTATSRWCAHIPPVIYHPDFHVFQVPYLHIETPSDGTSSKGLAQAILEKIDSLVPGAKYCERYIRTGREGVDNLILAAARVMNIHFVGILICDEIQNIALSKKGNQRLMAELVSLCNRAKCPILFIGTNKATKVLTKDFSKARRGTGEPLEPWDRLAEGTYGDLNDWDSFIKVLWSYQWVRHPTNLTEELSSKMYECSQGVIDIALKLFATVQGQAMHDGLESITSDLIDGVYESSFKLVHPMLEALKLNDYEMLTAYEDIAPINLEHHLNGLRERYVAKTSAMYKVRSGDPTFIPRIQNSLMAIGIDSGAAEQAALDIAAQGDSIVLKDGLQRALTELSPKSVRKSFVNKSSTPKSQPLDTFDSDMSDYRRAIVSARHHKTTVFKQLEEMGWAPNIDAVIPD